MWKVRATSSTTRASGLSINHFAFHIYFPSVSLNLKRRVQPLPSCAPLGGTACRLSYAVEIRPKGFLPVGLIQNRVASDLQINLAAIRDFVEKAAESELPDTSIQV